MAKTPVWQRKAGQNPSGGLNEAGRRSLRAEGHDIKRPQPEGGARKKSFCARMEGAKKKLTSSETANDPDSRINKSLRKWNCADGGAVDPYEAVQKASSPERKHRDFGGFMSAPTVAGPSATMFQAAQPSVGQTPVQTAAQTNPAMQANPAPQQQPAPQTFNVGAMNNLSMLSGMGGGGMGGGFMPGMGMMGGGMFGQSLMTPFSSSSSYYNNPFGMVSPMAIMNTPETRYINKQNPFIFNRSPFMPGGAMMAMSPQFSQDRNQPLPSDVNKNVLMSIMGLLFGGNNLGFFNSGYKDGGAVEPYDAVQKAAKGGEVWDKPRPKKLGKPEPLSSKEKKSAKAAAKAAGRPYPNLIDNMRAARADGGEVEGDVQFADDDPYAKVQEASKLPMMAQNDFAMRMPQPEVRYDTGPQPGEATLKGYDPTIKERIYQGIAGTEERPSPERAQFARGMSQMAEFAPVLGNVMAGQEAQRRGDTKGMLMAALPVPGMATEARMAEAAIGPAEQAAREAYQRVLNAQGLYSHAAESAANLPQAKGSYEQMMAMLQKAGVKPEEMRWSGVEQFAGQPVTREQLASHFEQNVPKIEETVLGSPDETKLNEADAAVREAIRVYNEGQVAPRYYAHNPERSYASSFFPTREEAAAHISTLPESYHAGTTVAEFPGKPIDVYETMRRLHNGEFVYNLPPGVNRAALNLIDERNALAEAAEQSGTKFGQYTLPGGQNYREVLLGLGAKKNAPVDSGPSAATMLFQRDMMEKYGSDNFPSVYNKLSPSEIDKYEMLVREDRNASKTESMLQDRQNNYRSQHWDQPNVLGHLRMSDRTGPEGEKILHLEELQSDWGQAGRKQGFETKEMKEAKDRASKEFNDYSKQLAEKYDLNPNQNLAMYGRLKNMDPSEVSKYEELQKIASEAGAFKSKTIPSAPYVEKTQNWVDLGLKRALKEAAEGGYSKMVWTPGEEQAARYDLSKHIDELHWHRGNLVAYDKDGNKVIQRTGMSASELPDLVGKDVADKLLAQEAGSDGWRSLEGQDLKVGGEGMKGFYDKIVPSRLKELLKKIDPQAKIEMGGHEIGSGKYQVMTPDGSVAATASDLRTANNMAREMPGSKVVPEPGTKAHSITITPKMREAILKGLPAYADGGEVTGDVKSDPYADVQRAAMGDWAREEAAKPSPLKGLMDIGTVGATYGLEKARERMEEPLEPARQLVQQSVVEPAKSAYHIAAQSTGEEPFDPYTAVQHASNVAGALTLGAGAFERPAGSLAMGASRVKDPFPYFGGAEIPGGYGSIASPFHPDPALRAEALKMGQKYITPVEGRYVGQPGSYYSTAQSAHPLDVSPTIIGTPKSVGKGDIILKPTNEMTWEQFAKQGKGGTLINLAGDRMNFGRLTHINDRPLAWPVDIQAGPKYMREPNPGEVWANDPNAATGIRKAIQSASERGPVYGVYTPMGAQAVNSSHNMFEAIMAQIPGSGISKADMKEFDAAIKSGKQVIGNTPKIVAKRKNAIELMKNWPGIANAKEASEFAKTLPGVHRTDIINMIEKGSWRDKGFPNVGMTRVALTDPQFLRAPNNMMGGRMVELSPERTTTKPKQFTHVSYPIETYGKYLADVPLVQRQYVMPEVMKRYVKPTATGTVVHPYSLQDMGRNSFRKVFETNVHQQPINQEFLDSVMLGLERQKEYGFKKGGAVSQRKDPADPLRAAVVYPHSKPKASR